ncbi:hypothetical protein ABT297_33175 [Dactylosporangium sp. NPDC000555]
MSDTTVAVGTRLRCASCGSELVVVRPPAGVTRCCGAPMTTAGR